MWLDPFDRGRDRGAKKRSMTRARVLQGGVSEKVKDGRKLVLTRGVKVGGDATGLKEGRNGGERESDPVEQWCPEMHGEGQG